MIISVLLPYKENFSSDKAGAVSLFVKDMMEHSLYKKNIYIFGETLSKKVLSKNYINLNLKNKFYFSKTSAYLKLFLKNKNFLNSDLIEIHNRPLYVNIIKIRIDKKVFLYFHNDPLKMKGSKKISERISLLRDCEKIIFNSLWCKNNFLKDLNDYRLSNKLIVIPQSTNKIKIDFKKKEKLISFIGKLNTSKGYDLFGAAIIKILDEFSEWKAIVIGDEKREKYNFHHKNLIKYGFKTNKFILKKLSKVSISVVPSVWDEPFGRSSLEASSRGCALVISKQGGLPETTNDALFLKKINEKEIYSNIKKLIIDKKLRNKLQKETYKNFFLTNEYISSKIDKIRKVYEINQYKIKDVKKILHVANFNERFDGRLHYNTGKRINNGFIRLGFNVLSVSDRDILNNYKNFKDIDGSKSLNIKILNNIHNFKPDLIVIGHADGISIETIKKINEMKIKICQWFLDPLNPKGPDYIKNKNRVLRLDKFLDATFITTHPTSLNFKLKNAYFIPNPSDESFEFMDISKLKPKKDLFFAMSHGVHRGKLKSGKIDKREFFLKILKKKLINIKFDIFGMDYVQPIWADKFIEQIKNYKMGLNLSRGKPIKYYSSDRIVQLIGNGLLTFIDIRTKLNEIISPTGVVYYNGIKDLTKKILFYASNPDKIKKIASEGKKQYLKKFNSKKVGSYIVEKTFNFKTKNRYHWH